MNSGRVDKINFTLLFSTISVHSVYCIKNLINSDIVKIHSNGARNIRMYHHGSA